MDEYEYGLSWNNNYPVVVDEEGDRERLEQRYYGMGKMLRRKVGPWEEVPDGH